MLQGKHKQAVSTKSGRIWSEASSDEGEDKVLVYNALKRQSWANCVERKMDVDGEVDSKKNLDQRKKDLFKQVRKIDEFTDMPRKVVDEHEEKWRQELQEIEQRRK